MLRFCIELYTNQKLRVKWLFSISELFCVKNGVKQGVLSPVLFSIYFDELMTRVRTAGMAVMLVVVMLDPLLMQIILSYWFQLLHPSG